ncbi:MAG: CHAT domain-containing protein [Candidatus Aminicenantales bacterium]
MREQEHREIARMDWGKLEESLQIEKRGKRGGASGEAALREYFGDEEYAYLQKLATHARTARSWGPIEGNIVFVPGIMGSNLITIEKDGNKDLVWVNLFRLAAGQIKRLKLTPDGSREANPKFSVQPSELDKRTYARTILWLRASWNVEPFAFDWRKDIDSTADALATFIRTQYPDQPVNLLAHSMGGLVCRDFIRRHRDQWDAMRGKEGGKGGRLVMLGTPNYGSFAIPQAMTGKDRMVKLLAAADLTDSLSGILAVINTFVGSYQMLPSPSKLPPAQQMLYRRDSWGSSPVSDRHLGRALQFHADMERQDIMDPERMVYIAGCNQKTLCGLKINAPGEFEYQDTPDGDGRVPHSLGILPDVPTYYIDESHGDLPRNEQVLSAVSELMVTGRTSVLSDKPIVSRAVAPAGYRRRNLILDQNIGKEVRDIALRTVKKESKPEEVRFVEEAIMRSIIGRNQAVGALPSAKEMKVPRGPKKTMKLAIEVVRGDVTQIKAPVVMIGHYQGVAPVSAEGAIDKALDFWITRANQQGIIGADLGELFFIPVVGRSIAARAVLLAGMGAEGRFSKDDLRYLMTNVTVAVSALKLDTFATVLIGSGAGNLTKDRALRGMIEGIADALRRLPEGGRIRKLILVENDDDVYETIMGALNHMRDDKVFPDLALSLMCRKLPLPSRGKKKPPPDIPSEPLPGTRITIERDREIYRFSALSETAVVPVREVEVQSFFAAGTAERLMSSTTPEEQIEYGQLLSTYLIPQDFRQLIEEEDALTLILDRSTASFPWEMACFKSARGTIFFGPDRMLTRQFRTMLASPGLTPPLNRSLKVLVIADPAPEPEYQLPGARQEGRAVVNVLERLRKEEDLDITVYEHIGASECDPVEILALLLSEEFDIVHYAGHGVFDEKDPSHSGWVFGRDCILSAREIFRARRVPRLVFANACFSAVIKERQAMTADEMNRRLAGLAEAFFERGIQNYIGAGWPVEDDPAVEFASVFYQKALAGETLGESLAAARKRIMGQGSTWGAYQHYGQVNGTLITRK